jgi:uncharacterized YigZ family protein
MSEYKTLAGISHGLFKEKGSKFLSYAYPIQDEREVKPILDQLKSRYHDARHHCYAYRVGINGESTRTNDDGEPSNSAGKPILGQIIAFDLTQCLIIVVRYFGGTLLGRGGLAMAYKLAARLAIENGNIITITTESIIELAFEYHQLNNIMRIVEMDNLKILEQQYDDTGKISIVVPDPKASAVVNRFNSLNGVRVCLKD